MPRINRKTELKEGRVHDKCGTTEKYASSGNCRFCSLATAALPEVLAKRKVSRKTVESEGLMLSCKSW